MTRETEIKVALVLAAARLIESKGRVRYETPEQLAALSRELGEPVSASTFQRDLRTGMAKTAYALRQKGIHSATQNLSH